MPRPQRQNTAALRENSTYPGGGNHVLMRPSSISATIDGSLVTQARTSMSSVNAQSRPSAGNNDIAMQQGELARTATRLLGIGPVGQAWRGMAQPLLTQTFGGHRAAETGAATWIAARVLPTPQGHARAVAIRPTATIRPVVSRPATAASTGVAATAPSAADGGNKFRAAVDAAHGPRRERPVRRTRFTIR